MCFHFLVFVFVDVLIDVPNQLDLSHLKGRGLQPG